LFVGFLVFFFSKLNPFAGALELRLARLEGIVCQCGNGQLPWTTHQDVGGSLARRIAATAGQIDLKIASAAGKVDAKTAQSVNSLSARCMS
jgi:hypothetical protein